METGQGYGVWLHGEAVSAGMVMAAWMSHRLGWIDQSLRDRTKQLLEAANLPVHPPKEMTEKARTGRAGLRRGAASYARLVRWTWRRLCTAAGDATPGGPGSNHPVVSGCFALLPVWRITIHHEFSGDRPVSLCLQTFRDLMAVDKKVANGKLRLILLKGPLGSCVFTGDFDKQALDDTLREFCSSHE